MTTFPEKLPVFEHHPECFLIASVYITEANCHSLTEKCHDLQSLYGIHIKYTCIFDTIQEMSLADQEQTLLHIVQQHQCTSIVIDTNVHFPPELSLALRAQGVLLIAGNILTTMPTEPGEVAAMALYDMCITTDQATNEALHGLGITPIFQPILLDLCLAAQPIAPQANRPIGIMFVGSVWGHKQNSQQRLAALAFLHAQGIMVCCLGSGFPHCQAFTTCSNDFSASQKASSDSDDPVSCLQQAAIGIVFDDSPDVRVLQVLLAGALLLCPETAFVRQHLTPGQDVATFSSLDDLAAQCTFYLQHDDERLAIAKRGFAKAHQYFRRDRLLQAVRGRMGDALSPGKASQRIRCLRARILFMLLEPEMSPESRHTGLLPLLQSDAGARVLKETLATLPSHLRLPATISLENVLLFATTSKEQGLAEVLAPICLQSSLCHSPSLVLACSLAVYKNRPDALAAVTRRYDILIEALFSLANVTGTTDDPFFDDMYIKHRLYDCARKKHTAMLFGAGSNGQAWAAWIRQHLPPMTLYFIDNNQQIQNTAINDLLVLSPDDMACYPCDFIMVTSSFWRQIQAQLISRGYNTPKDVLFTKGLNPLQHDLCRGRLRKREKTYAKSG